MIDLILRSHVFKTKLENSATPEVNFKHFLFRKICVLQYEIDHLLNLCTLDSTENPDEIHIKSLGRNTKMKNKLLMITVPTKNKNA